MLILFVGPNRIGDAVVACGVLDHLIRTYPDCRITIACGPVAEGVFAAMPHRERTIVFAKQRYDLHWLYLWRQVVGIAWDLVVDVRGSGLGYLVWARRRVVRGRHSGPMFEQHAAMLGVDPAPLPVAWTSVADRDNAAALLPPGRPYVGFGPTASWPGKAWPGERFAALFGRLAGALPGAMPVIFGGPGAAERAMAAPALAALCGAVDLCGSLSLSQTAACIQRCGLYVGNDSGLMHLAAATGVPVVGLCGTTMGRAAEMAPAGRCAVWAMGDGPSMEALSVETVYATCVQLLATADCRPDSETVS